MSQFHTERVRVGAVGRGDHVHFFATELPPHARAAEAKMSLEEGTGATSWFAFLPLRHLKGTSAAVRIWYLHRPSL
jgi:hypothetical protein